MLRILAANNKNQSINQSIRPQHGSHIFAYLIIKPADL